MPEGWRVGQAEVRADRLAVGGGNQRDASAPIVERQDRRVIGRQQGLIGSELGDLHGRRGAEWRGRARVTNWGRPAGRGGPDLNQLGAMLRQMARSSVSVSPVAPANGHAALPTAPARNPG